MWFSRTLATLYPTRDPTSLPRCSKTGWHQRRLPRSTAGIFLLHYLAHTSTDGADGEMLQGVADALQVDLSGAIPGVLPPVTAESDLLVDSGVPKETCPNFGD